MPGRPERGEKLRLFSAAISFIPILVACKAVSQVRDLATVPPSETYRSIQIKSLDDIRLEPFKRSILNAITKEFRANLDRAGFTARRPNTAGARSLAIQVQILDCSAASKPMRPVKSINRPYCLASVTASDIETGHTVTALAVKMPGPKSDRTQTSSPWDQTMISRAAKSLSNPLISRFSHVKRQQRDSGTNEVITTGGMQVLHLGGSRFRVGKSGAIDLSRLPHGYKPNVDPDVHFLTDITLNDRVPPLTDPQGRQYALITLYHIDPPLDDLPSRETGIDRGTDFRSPAMLVKAAYSNYVSPVLTNDKQRLPVPGHPIGHFYVKVEIPGYPTILTGSTTVARADVELTELTLGRELGIGGVLLTPQPGRLNPAVEALEELSLRQRQLRVVDGLFYRERNGRNVGPEYIIEDGNVSFARFKLPLANAKDSLAMLMEYIHRGGHKIFGSLINRPHRGTGAGCTPFAMAWLKASGILPFVAELKTTSKIEGMWSNRRSWRSSLIGLQRTLRIPWDHIGCDERMGLGGIEAAKYTIYDLVFHGETSAFISRASEGLARKVRESQGAVVGTLFRFGALSPLRDLIIDSKRKDPGDKGDYNWAGEGEGWSAKFWDNDRFSKWIKLIWEKRSPPPGVRLVREGRFRGIEIDAMKVPRQRAKFFADAVVLEKKLKSLRLRGVRPTTCQQLYGLDIQ